MVVSCPGRSGGSLHGTGGWGSGVRRQLDATCQGTGSERVRALELLLESGAGTPYPPRGRLQLLPSAQALRAQPALPSGERQGDLVPKRERGGGPGEREASRPGSSSERRPAGRRERALRGVAGSAAVAARGLGCGTHRPAARPCRSGPRTGA